MLLIGSAQHAIESRFRGQITALIRQPRHDLARRQVGMLRAVAHDQDGVTLVLAQGIDRRGVYRCGSCVGLHDVLFCPALQGAQGYTQLFASHGPAGSARHGFS